LVVTILVLAVFVPADLDSDFLFLGEIAMTIPFLVNSS
jgi:hypothetical protein